jgi:hypothetical protein
VLLCARDRVAKLRRHRSVTLRYTDERGRDRTWSNRIREYWTMKPFHGEYRVKKETEVVTALDKQVGGSHYKDLAIQPVEFCQRNRLNFCESEAIKYITRHRFKNGRQDIEKAIHCLELLLQIDYEKPKAV